MNETHGVWDMRRVRLCVGCRVMTGASGKTKGKTTMLNKMMFLLTGAFIMSNAMADEAPLLLANQNIVGGCNILNLGVSSGTAILIPQFSIATYNCSAGTYLPADGVECVQCPKNYYCVGGAYQYNTDIAQGIMECPNSWYSPAGMHELESCGRILHIGDQYIYLRSAPKTTPALRVDVDNDGVADFFGNVTLSDVNMNVETSRKLKVNFGNTTYSIYDDSVNTGN